MKECTRYCSTLRTAVMQHPLTQPYLRGFPLWSLQSSAQVAFCRGALKLCRWKVKSTTLGQRISSQQRSAWRWLPEQVCREPRYLLSVSQGAADQYSMASWCVFVQPTFHPSHPCVYSFAGVGVGVGDSDIPHIFNQAGRESSLLPEGSVLYLPFNLSSIWLFSSSPMWIHSEGSWNIYLYTFIHILVCIQIPNFQLSGRWAEKEMQNVKNETERGGYAWAAERQTASEEKVWLGILMG